MRVKCGKAVPSSRHSQDLPPSQACLLLNTQIQRHCKMLATGMSFYYCLIAEQILQGGGNWLGQ